ncbi:MAG: Bax inhibitor-1/YccA family protein [Eubacteriales bacterium]|nr:Bax inhibitor-1/YccA family protein [Eubacteriales bacterium]
MTLEQSTAPRTISRMTNPMLRKLVRVEASEGAAEGARATYGGVAAKSIFFLLLTAAGAAAYFVLHGVFAKSGADLNEVAGFSVYSSEMTLLLIAAAAALLCSLLAWPLRPLAPVLGTVYSLAQGYSIAMISASYAAQYQGIIMLALLLTLAIVFSMLVLYASGIVKIGRRFKAVVATLFFASLLGGAGVFALNLIWPNSPVAALLSENGPVAIAGAVAGIVIAALFLLSDFDTIEQTVSQGLAKKYEWFAAFGLVITILWLYLKVLSLLKKFKKNNKS